MASVTLKHERFLPGMEVAAYPLSAVNPSRRTGGLPGLAPTASAVVGADSALTITAAAGTYALLAVVDEEQTVTVDATSGDFTLDYNGEETDPIDFDADEAAFKAALVALPNIGASDVEVTGGPGDSGGTTPYTVRFLNTLSGTNVAELVADGTNLLGGGATVTVETTVAGTNSRTGGPAYVIAKTA